MSLRLVLMFTLSILTVLSCGKKKKKSDVKAFSNPQKEVAIKTENKVLASKRVDLVNKGVGPVTSVELSASVDTAMASRGEDIFKKKCTACHRTDKKFIGPPPKGILSKRTPEWVMNMILNPDVMLKNDALARDLLIEFNGAPMANQNLTRQEARDVLEYFRTL